MQLTIALQSAVNSALLTKRKASIQSARQSGATKLRFTSDRASCACLSNKAFNSAQPQAWPSRSELPPDQLPTGFVRFQASDLRSEVQIFGLCHLTAELEPAEWIWEHRPSAGAAAVSVHNKQTQISLALVPSNACVPAVQCFLRQPSTLITARLLVQC